jgi:hypothetical protein
MHLFTILFILPLNYSVLTRSAEVSKHRWRLRQKMFHASKSRVAEPVASIDESLTEATSFAAKLLQGLRDVCVGCYWFEVAVNFVLLFANRLEKGEATVDINPG